MKTFVSQAKFMKALEYASEHFFSKPYSISPMVDRWFNQLSMVQLAGKSTPIHLSGDVAKKHVDIILDGKVVDKAKIELIIKFHSQKATFEKVRITLVTQNEELARQLEELNEKKRVIEQKISDEPANDGFKQELIEHQKLIDKYSEERNKIQTVADFDKDKAEAKQLFDDIVKRGTSALNIESLEKEYNAKVTNIVHRPNHGLAHSVRAAYSITSLQTYRTEHGVGPTNLREPEIEKLQLMMLFSVVGRKDETGFADTGNNATGCDTYESFRTTSGREYLKYIEANAGHLYPDMESRYRDAIVVELMGYNDIQNAIDRRKIPEVLLDYIIKKEADAGRVVTQQEAHAMAQRGTTYSIAKMFPDGPIRDKASDMLVMMNEAHALDLTRCYPLYPTTGTGPKSVGILSSHLNKAGFSTFTIEPSAEKLTSFFKLMRNSFDTLALTGQNSMFGMLSEQEFEAQKKDILKQVKDISDFCKDPLNRAELLKKARAANAADNSENYFSSRNTHDSYLLADYRDYLITRAISERFGGIIENYLGQSNLLLFSTAPEAQRLDQFFKLMSSSYNILPGKTILSQSEYDSQKGRILVKMKAISDDCKDSARFDALVAEAKLAKADKDNAFTSNATTNKALLKDYRTFLIASAVVKDLTGETLKESLKSRLYADNRMFDFQQTKDGDLAIIDHHQTALKVIEAFQTITPIPSVTKASLPIISAVKHDRSQNKIVVTFDSMEQAQQFQDTYQIRFSKSLTITPMGSTFSIEADRTLYKELLAGRLIEFKPVEIVKKIEREEQLIDDEGNIDALGLVSHSRALVRLVSTTALGGESFPDYDYLLRAFDDPIHERHSGRTIELEHLPIEHTRYRDPRSGVVHTRTVVSTPVPEVRFQEPVIEPKKFADTLADGWTVSAEGSKAKNTLFTKKLAHTLLPSHGKVVPFPGYRDKASFYFPIGVLSDIEKVDLKDERYVWAQNMQTILKTWIRDPSVFAKGILLTLDADLDGKSLRRHKDGVAKLDQEKVQGKIDSFTSKDTLVTYLQKNAAKFTAKLNERHYRPTDVEIVDFKRLIMQQQQAYLKGVVGNTPADKELQKKVKAVFSGMLECVNEEGLRKGLKYSMSVRELVKFQEEQYRKNPDAPPPHNEVLAANTKGATRALYASKDALFDRLNLALHAMKIKEKYGYDVPLLVMSQNKAPYHYTEALIKKDMQEAHKLIKEGKFPYDRTMFKVYELDAKGNIKEDKNGNPIIKLNERGKEIQIPKSIKLQQEMLVELFKTGMPKLSSIHQLAAGRIGKQVIGDSERDAAIDAIANKMNVIGSLKRETALMEKVFAKVDGVEREKFFLRAVALGHQSLVEKMIARDDFKPSVAVLEKGITFANKNNHTALSEYLTPLHANTKEAIENVERQLARLKSIDGVGALPQKARIEALVILEQLRTLASTPELNDAVKKVTMEVLLNTESQKLPANRVKLPELMKLLATENEAYRTAYAELVQSGKPIDLVTFTAEHKKYGAETMVNVMRLAANSDNNTNLHYKHLLGTGEKSTAEKLLTFALKNPGDSLDAMKKECKQLVISIKTLSSTLIDKERYLSVCGLLAAATKAPTTTTLPLAWVALVAANKELVALDIDESLLNIRIQVAKFARDPSTDPEAHTKQIEDFYALYKQYKALNVVSDVEQLFAEKAVAILGNSASILEPEALVLNQQKKDALPKTSKGFMQKIAIQQQEKMSVENLQAIPLMMKIMEQNPSYRKPFAQMIASGHAIKINELVAAQEQFGERAQLIVPNMMQLATSLGWKEAGSYLALQSTHPDKAQSFYDVKVDAANKLKELIQPGVEIYQLHELCASGSTDEEIQKLLKDEVKVSAVKIILTEHQIKENTAFDEGMALIDKIQKASLSKGDKIDKNTDEFCAQWKTLLSNSKGDYATLLINLDKIKIVHKAVTSVEMEAVTKTLGEFERRAKEDWFTVGNQRKADRIRSAAIDVPLLERAALFSNEQTPSCKRVRKELASHRISLCTTVDEENRVIEKNAAKSFAMVKTEIATLKQGFKELRATEAETGLEGHVLPINDTP